MSLTRLNYDLCTYKHNLKQSVGTADYQINTPRVECHGCFATDPSLTMGKYGATLCGNQSLIDVDSELKILNKKASNCPTQKYLPSGKPFCDTSVPLKDCRYLPQEDTRLSNPPCTLRSTGINRWEWLCQNPQEKALVPFDFNISNRIIVKDNHRPCIPKPLSMTEILPAHHNDDSVVEYGGGCMQEDTSIPSIHWRKVNEYEKYLQ